MDDIWQEHLSLRLLFKHNYLWVINYRSLLLLTIINTQIMLHSFIITIEQYFLPFQMDLVNEMNGEILCYIRIARFEMSISSSGMRFRWRRRRPTTANIFNRQPSTCLDAASSSNIHELWTVNIKFTENILNKCGDQMVLLLVLQGQVLDPLSVSLDS